MENNYDYIIIGSGFGGSVSALRLSEKGYKVLVIEKGKWYNAKDFAKTNWNLKKWFWIPSLRFFGIMRLSIFRHIVTISGTGVGGGSLVYANTLPIPKSGFFKTGSWSDLADWETELRPFYYKALKMLGANKNPKLFDGDLVLKDLALHINKEEKFEHSNVAVYFGKEEIKVKDPYFEGEGPDIKGCNFCGSCMTGCRNEAKNTLDKNYLFLAQKNGTEILAENEVINIIPMDGTTGSSGYRVITRASTSINKRKKEFTAKGIVLSGGVLGTVKLLLKLKKSSLPRLSDKLGDQIRTNNETLISISTLEKDKDLSKGIAIGSILHTDENSHLEVVRYGKGSGFWKLLHLPYTTGENAFVRILKMIGSLLKSPLSYFKIYFINNWSTSTAILLFMQTVDSTLRFRRNFLGWMVSSVSTGVKPTPDIPESLELTKKYCEIIHGKATSFMLEALAGIPSTAHILGGAVMGKDAAHGVINLNNEVFGYKNMYVIDGSMISANPGVNPALSITAIAERAIDKIKPNSHQYNLNMKGMSIEKLINRQRDLFNSNKTKDVTYRIDQLKKFKRVLKANEEILYKAIYEDFGKSEFETYLTEIGLIYHEINLLLKNIKKWSKVRRVRTDLPNFPARSYILPEPLGVTLIIGAWNYPYQISLVPAVTSLAAGNTVILKPSELPSKTSEAMANIINTNFPENYFHVVEGGTEITTDLLSHRFDKIFFTGSIPVGKIIYQAAAKHLTPVTLELGGKSPTFVLSDCDIEIAAKRIVWAKYLNTGQTCVAPDYLLVDSSIEAKLLEAMKKEIGKNYNGHSMIGENYTRIINEKNFIRLHKLIDKSKLYHGGITNKDQRYIAPTILRNVSFEDEIMQDEIFGPILPVISYTDLNDAVKKVKERPRPLACYIYSKNRNQINKLLKELSFGGGAINESVVHLSNSNLPFGGVGMSGIGSYHGKAGFDTFTHYKSILDKPTWFEPPIRYVPYTPIKRNIIKWIFE